MLLADPLALGVINKKKKPEVNVQATTQVDGKPSTAISMEQQEFKDEQTDQVNESDDEGTIFAKPTKPLYPNTATDDPDDMIEVNFENADLSNLLSWLESTYGITFITDDAISPLPAGGKAIAGNKITFKTHKALTKKQVWDLVLTFLDLFGLGLVETAQSTFYKVVTTDQNSQRSINRNPLPSYINIRWAELPHSDARIRYTYFVNNSTLGTIQPIVDAFRSVTSSLKPLPDLNAFIITDKASNIRSIMQIVEELDGASMPEAMSVLKLKHADAEDVKNLFDNLTKSEDSRGLAARLMGAKKTPTTVYFPENTRIFAERRTNTLIILGTQEGINKVEEFIVNYVDTALKIPYSPLYIYELQYTKAEDIATILTNVTKFAQDSAAAQAGGVRDNDKYLRPMTFQAESSGNRLLINAEKEDYLKVLEIIKQLDVKQPQVAIEVLIVNVTSTDNREIGVQIRNKDLNTINKNVDFQTSGFPSPSGPKSPVIDSTTGSIAANLISLAQNQTPGATLISIANGLNGVWAMFKILETRIHANVVSNPFLTTTNNYTAQVSLGESRYVQTGQIQSQLQTATFGYVTANVTVNITPLINNDGNINLDISINIDSFTDATNPQSATKDTKTVKTNANVGNGEVLALGGLLKTNISESISKVPFLGDIPVLGWLFKNKVKVKSKDNLLVFISPRVVEPQLQGGMDEYSKDKEEHAKAVASSIYKPAERRDAIHRWFFHDNQDEQSEYIDSFIQKNNQAECRDVRTSSFYQNKTTLLGASECPTIGCSPASTSTCTEVIEKILRKPAPKNSITMALPHDSMEANHDS
jgi:general secretion pathway protein D